MSPIVFSKVIVFPCVAGCGSGAGLLVGVSVFCSSSVGVPQVHKLYLSTLVVAEEEQVGFPWGVSLAFLGRAVDKAGAG